MIQTKKKRINKFNKSKRENKIFTEKDYNNGNGMLTTVWGPSMWHSLHTISFNYPVHPTRQDKKRYRDFILSLQYVLPCKYCRINIRKNFIKLPLTQDKMKDRASFSRYLYDLHELINTMIGKNSGLSYEDVRERYEHFRANCVVDKPRISVTKNKTRKHRGCVRPLYGKKAKCVIHIVPQERKIETFQMDDACIKKRDIT